jgi:hypothetical protein
MTVFGGGVWRLGVKVEEGLYKQKWGKKGGGQKKATHLRPGRTKVYRVKVCN